MWQTDFTYFKIVGWGWYYLSTVLDDYSRCIVAWRLCTSMSASDVSDTLDDALSFTGLDQVKIERWHRSMKNQILLNHYYLPSELQEQLQHFVNYYHHERYHESLDNLTEVDPIF